LANQKTNLLTQTQDSGACVGFWSKQQVAQFVIINISILYPFKAPLSNGEARLASEVWNGNLRRLHLWGLTGSAGTTHTMHCLIGMELQGSAEVHHIHIQWKENGALGLALQMSRC
jgi:hypothetical protein